MLLQVIIGGLAEGGIYALLGLAIVFIMRGTRIFNFAQGELAMASAFFAYIAISDWHIPYWLSFILAAILGSVLGILIDRMIRLKAVTGVEAIDSLSTLVICLGLFSLIDGASGLIYGTQTYNFPNPFPEKMIQILGAAISPIHIGILCVAALLALGLYFFLNRTTVGLTFRAAAEDTTTATLMGIGTRKVSAITWAIGSAIGAISAMLIAPMVNVSISMMQPPLVLALAGIILGGISNVYGAILGGLLIGLISNLIGLYIGSLYMEPISFGIMIIILLAMPQGILGRRKTPTRA